MAYEYFCAYHSYERTIKRLTDEEVGRLFRALLSYSETGIEPDLSGPEGIAFDSMAANIDRDRKTYEAKCQTNSENGKKGGRPAKPKGLEKNPKNRTVFSETQKTQEKEEDKEKEEDYISPSIEGRDSPPIAPPKKSGKKILAKVQCAEFVSMTSEQYQKLLDEFGSADTKRLIEILDNYKGSTGKKYKDDFRAIQSWCIDRLLEEKKKDARNVGGGNVFMDMLEELHG